MIQKCLRSATKTEQTIFCNYSKVEAANMERDKTYATNVTSNTVQTFILRAQGDQARPCHARPKPNAATGKECQKLRTQFLSVDSFLILLESCDKSHMCHASCVSRNNQRWMWVHVPCECVQVIPTFDRIFWESTDDFSRSFLSCDSCEFVQAITKAIDKVWHRSIRWWPLEDEASEFNVFFVRFFSPRSDVAASMEIAYTLSRRIK